MDSRKNQELEEKLEKFEKYIERSIEVNKESDQESIKNGEYKYLIESHNIQADCELSESLQEALDNSSLSKDDLLEKVVKDENFEMEYEGNHEPDAEKYECTHCETRNSYGIEILFMSGDVEIVDTEDESNIEESY